MVFALPNWRRCLLGHDVFLIGSCVSMMIWMIHLLSCCIICSNFMNHSSRYRVALNYLMDKVIQNRYIIIHWNPRSVLCDCVSADHCICGTHWYLVKTKKISVCLVGNWLWIFVVDLNVFERYLRNLALPYNQKKTSSRNES